MTVKNFWHDTLVPTSQANYFLIFPNGHARKISRSEAAQHFTNPELPLDFRVERRVTTNYVTACPWCGVRPLQYERDCDGWASTGTCGSEQCNQLKRCEGCGKDDSVRYGSVRGQLCEDCFTRARRDNLEACRGRYALAPWGEAGYAR